MQYLFIKYVIELIGNELHNGPAEEEVGSHERKHVLYLSTHHYRAERC